MAWDHGRKAVGLYEVGFFAAKFPAKAVRVGERWKVPFVLAQESRKPPSDIYEKITVKQTGGEIVFTLEAVATEPKLRIARIGYISKGQASISVISKALVDGKSIEDVNERGTIWIDIASGWPIRAKLSRVVTTRWDGQTSVEKSTTDVKRVTK
jgi:hypothetical protein